MGYGNQIFDGDEPLPASEPEQRILSMRLWRRPLFPVSRAKPADIPERDRDEDGGGRGAKSQWGEG